jgi:cytochrome c
MKIPGLCRHDRRSCTIAGLVGNPSLDPQDRVQPINHCGDTYKVATDGKVRDFWNGTYASRPMSATMVRKRAPALVGAGMMGDRVDVIFDWPEEISVFIANAC